jgi:signal transduction histidine kinase
MNDLMRGILGRGDNDITFRVYDGADKQADRRMYESDHANTNGVDDVGSTVFSATHTLNIAGREWALDFESGPNFISAGEENQPFIVAAGAIIIDLLLFLTISSLTNQRRNALKMARRMTKEIRFAKDLAERSTEREIVLRQATEESNRKLEEANEGLLKFSSIVAHDLRAPLKRIETFAGILREDYKDRLDEDGLDILARMDRGSVRMRMMLDALHSYSKFSGVSLKGKYASINAVVEATVENLQEQLQGVKLTKDIDSGLIVAGDPHLLGNVFQNLISNSIKFSDKAVPEINIEVKLDGEDRIIASVSDNGIGIEPQYADKVFTMFERLHDEDEFEGTGIGLAIARKIIRDHKGEIEVDTTYVGGTRIHFHLPLYQGDEKSVSLDELQEVVGRDDEESAVAA